MQREASTERSKEEKPRKHEETPKDTENMEEELLTTEIAERAEITEGLTIEDTAVAERSYKLFYQSAPH